MELIDRGFLKSTRFLESAPYGSPPSKSRIYEMNLPFTLSKIRGAFGIEGTSLHALYEDKIFSLGALTFERRSYEVVFARCLYEGGTALKLLNYVRDQKTSNPLLLTSSTDPEVLQELSSCCPIFTLGSLLCLQKKGLVWRKSRLKTEHSKPFLKVQEGFYVSPDGHTVVKNGKTYYFQGFMQAQILKELWIAHKRGVQRLRAQVLFEKIGIKSTKLNQIFKDQKAWREVIVSKGGFCWLNF